MGMDRLATTRSVALLGSIAVHVLAAIVFVLLWLSRPAEEPEPIFVTILHEAPETETPETEPPREPLQFRVPAVAHVRESIEVPEQILALQPPPLEAIVETRAAAGGLSVERRSPRALGRIAVGGRGGGSAGRGVGAGNGTAPQGTFGEYIGGVRQAGLDVVFVVDATGSMGWLIDEVKGQVRRLADWTRRLVPVTRFGVVAYRDDDDPEFLVRTQPLTLSVDKVQRFLDGLEARGGGDVPEGVDAGLRAAIEKAGWKSDSKKVIVILGDAPPHPERLAETLELARGFRAAGGTITTVDVSFDANPEIAAARLGKRVDELQTLTHRGVLPEFDGIAKAGGGDGVTLEGEQGVVRQLAVLIFGHRWADSVRPLLETL